MKRKRESAGLVDRQTETLMDLTPAQLRAAIDLRDGEKLAQYLDPYRLLERQGLAGTSGGALPQQVRRVRPGRRDAPEVTQLRIPPSNAQWEKACPDYLRDTLRIHWKLAHDTDLHDAVAFHDAISRVYE
jgi:hypothetical protein